jgi:hypothetical protein
MSPQKKFLTHWATNKNGALPFSFSVFSKTEHPRSLLSVYFCKSIKKSKQFIMAGTTKDMSKIKQSLQLHLQGLSNRKIALIVDMDKETVNRYIRLAKADSMAISSLLKLDDPVLEHRLKGGSPAYPDERFERFKDKLPYFEREMRRPHVTLQLLWDEYKSEDTDGYSLTQFRHHYNQHVKAKKPGTVLWDTCRRYHAIR